jgi:Tfp pilus assembly protein FimV
VPTPKPVVPSSEARKDKAAAGRGPTPSNQEKLRQARNADRKAESAKAEPGKYVVEKGDSLWSIAEKNKPAGKSTAEYWNEVMKANPKGNFKSGNPSLIYSGEKVNLPGKAPAAPVDPKAQARKTEARRDKATAGRAPASKPASQGGPTPRAADKANEGKTVINTGAQTAKTEAKRDKTSAGRAPAPAAKPAVPAAEAKKDKAASGRAPVVTSEDKKDKAAAGRAPKPKASGLGPQNLYGLDKKRGSAGTRKRK